MNLWDETIEILKDNGSRWEDVKFITSSDFRITKDNFEEVATQTNYNNGYGEQYIDYNLQLHGDNFVVIRVEYDGFEEWKYISTKVSEDLKVKTVSKLTKWFIKKIFNIMEKYHEE